MIVVTGGTGKFGGLLIESLLRKGVEARDIRAVGRNQQRLRELAALGVGTAEADYRHPAGLEAALRDADRLMFVSGSESGQRTVQHGNVVAAARKARVARVVYTSSPHADTAGTALAREHRDTEEMILDSGLAHTILRNNWYTESYRMMLPQADATGEIVSDWGAGRVASASRADFAEGAATVLLDDGHDRQVYELTGDVAWTSTDLAHAVSQVLGKPVTLREVSSEEYVARLRSSGLPDHIAGMIGEVDAWIREGGLADVTPVLRNLIGRPTTPLLEGLRSE